MKNSAARVLFVPAVIGCLMLCRPARSHAAGIPRETALERFDANQRTVREQINNSDLISGLLISQMAVPIGDRPEVIGLFEEVISKSTSPASVQSAAYALELSVVRHRREIDKAQFPQIASSLEAALKQDLGLSVRLEIADALPRLGDKYRDASYQAHLDILSNPKSPLETLESKAMFLRAIEEVLDSKNPDSTEAARVAVERFRIRDYVAEQAERFKGQPLEKHYREILKRLDDLKPASHATEK